MDTDEGLPASTFSQKKKSRGLQSRLLIGELIAPFLEMTLPPSFFLNKDITLLLACTGVPSCMKKVFFSFSCSNFGQTSFESLGTRTVQCWQSCLFLPHTSHGSGRCSLSKIRPSRRSSWHLAPRLPWHCAWWWQPRHGHCGGTDAVWAENISHHSTMRESSCSKMNLAQLTLCILWHLHSLVHERCHAELKPKHTLHSHQA